jgi:hypothetical protein
MARNLNKKRATWRAWYHSHKKDHNKKTYFNKSKRKAVIKVWFESYKKTLACEVCGIKNPTVLDFHHKNYKKKEFSVGNFQHITQSIVRLKKEIEKCKVLCANCHRIEHSKERCDRKLAFVWEVLGLQPLSTSVTFSTPTPSSTGQPLPQRPTVTCCHDHDDAERLGD